MKICITAQGMSMDAAVDPRFGRAAFFVVYDTETRQFQATDNNAIHSGGGAGIAAAQQIIEMGASAVLTGNCGPNAFRTLNAGNVQVFTGVSGSVQDAVEAWSKGDLTQDSQPSVDSHNGMGPQG